MVRPAIQHFAPVSTLWHVLQKQTCLWTPIKEEKMSCHFHAIHVGEGRSWSHSGHVSRTKTHQQMMMLWESPFSLTFPMGRCYFHSWWLYPVAAGALLLAGAPELNRGHQPKDDVHVGTAGAPNEVNSMSKLCFPLLCLGYALEAAATRTHPKHWLGEGDVGRLVCSWWIEERAEPSHHSSQCCQVVQTQTALRSQTDY